MPFPLLAAKFYFPPARPSLVPRPRLVERLQTGIQGPLTLISAPAGCGKTTLLSEWRLGPGAGTPVAWLSLDEGDNDPGRFFHYLAACLDTVQPGLAQETLPLLSSPLPPPEAILTPLVNLLDQCPQDFVMLVLDDYHLIEAATIHQGVAFLLDRLPPRMHLVVLTRADPALPLARLRARGQVTEIRAEHLRFTPEETTAFLNEVMGLGLSAEDVAALEARTEGWIAGLQLAALSMQGRHDIQSFVSAFTGSHHYIVDYLVNEVLNRQPEEILAFLLKTSILNRLHGPLCDALLGIEEKSQSILKRLEQTNLFLIPLDDQQQWYRYHQLFADILRKQLQATHAGDLQRLHLRASLWLETNGHLDEAIRHALAAQDWPRALSLIDRTCADTYEANEFGKVLGWVQALPPAWISTSPALCVLYAWAVVLTGGYHEAAGILSQIDVLPESNLENPKRAVRAEDCILRLMEYARTRIDNQAVGRQTSLAEALALTYWPLGEVKLAAEMAARTAALAEQAGYFISRIFALGLLGRTQATLGHVRQAEATYQKAIQQHPDELLLRSGGFPHIGLAAIYYEWNDLTRSAKYARQGIDLGERASNAGIQVLGLRRLACIAQAQGDGQKAWDWLGQAAQVAKDSHAFRVLLDALSAQHVQIALAQGDLAAARRWLGDVAGPYGANYHGTTIPLERAKLAFAEGDRATAAALLAERYQMAVQHDLQFILVEIRVLQALAAEAEPQALAYLEDALTRAQPEGYVRSFLDQGAALKPLLQKALQRRIAPEHTTRLLAAFASEFSGLNTSPAPRARRPDILSQREAELLRLMSAGRSNREIAVQLFISVGTVKRHTANIFNKLDVKNRTEAVARARELGLL